MENSQELRLLPPAKTAIELIDSLPSGSLELCHSSVLALFAKAEQLPVSKSIWLRLKEDAILPSFMEPNFRQLLRITKDGGRTCNYQGVWRDIFGVDIDWETISTLLEKQAVGLEIAPKLTEIESFGDIVHFQSEEGLVVGVKDVPFPKVAGVPGPWSNYQVKMEEDTIFWVCSAEKLVRYLMADWQASLTSRDGVGTRSSVSMFRYYSFLPQQIKALHLQNWFSEWATNLMLSPFDADTNRHPADELIEHIKSSIPQSASEDVPALMGWNYEGFNIRCQQIESEKLGMPQRPYLSFDSPEMQKLLGKLKDLNS